MPPSSRPPQMQWQGQIRLPQRPMWARRFMHVSGSVARSLIHCMEQWDVNANDRLGKVFLCWILHNACALLNSKSHAHVFSAPDGEPACFPRRPADDPFVEALLFTNRAALVAFGITAPVEDHV